MRVARTRRRRSAAAVVLVVTLATVSALVPDLGRGSATQAPSASASGVAGRLIHLDASALLAAQATLPDTSTELLTVSEAYDAPAPLIKTSDGTYRSPLLAPVDGPPPAASLHAAPHAPAELDDTGHAGKVVNLWRWDWDISWYGPGLYGRRTACGYALTMALVGVANRTIPCGTIVQFRWNGRTVSAPVVDRGPYVAGRIFDMTYGLCAELGHCYTGSIQYRIP